MNVIADDRSTAAFDGLERRRTANRAGDAAVIHVEPQSPQSVLEALALSERFLLWNFRAWACCCRGQRLPAEPVTTAFANIGVPAAARALDAAMTRLVLATSRPLAVHCPPFTGLSDDERTLLAAAAAAQRHDRSELDRLFGCVLPSPAATLVGRAMMELGASIATVGILLPQPGPAAASAIDAPTGLPPGIQDWPARAAPTLH